MSENQEPQEQALNNDCHICKDKRKFQLYVFCNSCLLWYHARCLKLDPKKVDPNPNAKFTCESCKVQSTDPQKPEDRQNGDSLQSPSNPQSPNDNTQQEDNLRRHINTQNGNSLQSPSNLQPVDDTQLDDDQQQPEDEDSPNSSSDTDDETEDSGTDEEGYAGVEAIRNWKSTGNGRNFLIMFKKNKEERWLHEADLDGCVDMLNQYCKRNGLAPTTLEYKDKCGAPNEHRANKRNWASIDEIKNMVEIYGRRNGLKPEILQELGRNDALYLLQIGTHCYTILYFSDKKLCVIGDGENTYLTNKSSKTMVDSRLKGAREIKAIPFNNQKEKDHCASSAACIAIEFQLVYTTKNLPKELKPPPGLMKTMRARLHKEPGKIIREWKKVQDIKWRVQCDKCGKTFNTKSRAVLNIHKC